MSVRILLVEDLESDAEITAQEAGWRGEILLQTILIA
jgi:hypothetical protein